MRGVVSPLLVMFVTLSVQAQGADTFDWRSLPSLPDEFGFGGPVVGVHKGALIVAGGANFPTGPPWPEGDKQAGRKVWHDRIFVLLPGAKSWISAGKLPKPLAYAATISTNDGIYVLGGETYDDDTNQPTASNLLLQWDATKKLVKIVDNAIPPLPKPCRYHSATLIDDTIFVLASHAKTDSSARLDEKAFWSLNLRTEPAARNWTELKPWPGAPREKMAVATQTCELRNGDAEKCLFMFSGATWFKNADGHFDLSRFEHFTDAFRYNPRTAKWAHIADLPAVGETRDINVNGYTYQPNHRNWRPLNRDEPQPRIAINEIYKKHPRAAAAAVAIDFGRSEVLLFSGATGRYITLSIKQRPFFPSQVLAYSTRTDRWKVAGEMPIGVVTTGIAKWNNLTVIPSGEIRPGVRTNKVQAFTADSRVSGD